jgi:GTP-binding protein HflX
MDVLSGNLEGLASSERRMLERIQRRRVDPTQVVSPELARYLAECSRAVARQVGVLIDRRGTVEHVVVGDAERLWLPDVGRLRAGAGRLRGLRLVHTHLGEANGLTRDDLTDLAKLRLDLVAVIDVRSDGGAGAMHAAHLLPENEQGALWRELPPVPSSAPGIDFAELVRSLEVELAASTGAARATDSGSDRAVLIHVGLGRRARDGVEPRLAELRELARTAGLRVLDAVAQMRPQGPDPKYLIGRGKLDEVVMRALQRDATLLVFDPELTPAQARAIADATELKVIDRTMLILDIFAQHARTRDGKLQVELAQLRYALPRLVEKNTMMSRLTGGIGGRGPGETKLELGRRRARERIRLLEEEIRRLGRGRAQRRALRDARGVPVVAIVGYTNAGKSTLLNALTGADVLVEDKLFATLDPTSRRLRFPLRYLSSASEPRAAGSGRDREVVLTDTVGFIRDLPRDLVAAFRATLEELAGADLLVHVVDASDPALEAQMAAVDRILGELKLDGKRRLLVFNKSDRLGREQGDMLARDHRAIAVSALDRATLHKLAAAIERALWEEAAADATSSARPASGSPGGSPSPP